MRATLGIDLGTSGVRAVVLAANDEISARSIPLDKLRRCDPAALWSTVAAALDGLNLTSVGALAVDGTSGTLLPVAADGAATAGLSLYHQPARQDLRAAIAAAGPPGSAAQGATSALARAIELQHQPGTARVLHEADWVTGQFSGRFNVTDENNALKTGYDPLARAWPDWLGSTGMRIERLPRVVAPGTAVDVVTADVARRFGLPRDAVIVAGTTDGCASFLATGADQPGDAVTALGSTTTVKLLADVPVFAPDHGIYSHRLHERWLPGGASNAGGAVLAGFFTADQLRLLSAKIDPSKPSEYDYYPLSAPGERFPINDPTLPPRLAPRPADDVAFLHGLLEAVARIEALGYRRLAELGAPSVRRVLTVGGGAANPTWTAIRARVLGVPVHTVAGAEAALGAARLARRGLSSG